jgi:hypothetical protein
LGLLNRESETFRDQETMAQWIGKIRGRFEELTDSHENEIYDFVRENYKIRGKKFTNSAEFGAFMENIITKRTSFGVIDERLNINTFTPTSSVAAEYDAEIARAERDFAEAEKTLKEKRTEAAKNTDVSQEQIDKVLKKYTDAVILAEREVLRLREAKYGGVREAKASEMALFGLGDENRTRDLLLAKWNTSTLTAEEREKVRRASVLLGVRFDVSLQENTFPTLSENDMYLERIHITTDVPKFYLQNGHKALAQSSVDNLSNAVEGGVPMDFVPDTLPCAAVMDSSGSTLRKFRNSLGLYVRSTEREATATISLHPHLQNNSAFERAVFWHEYAHHIWENADTIFPKWQISLGKFWQKVKTTKGFTEAVEFQVREGIDFATQEEVWARAMTYFFLESFTDETARLEWHEYLEEYAWNKSEVEWWNEELREMLWASQFQI